MKLSKYIKRKTNLSYDELSNMMDKETWLSSQEAVELGFVNNITEAMKVAASFDLSKFTNVNEKKRLTTN